MIVQVPCKINKIASCVVPYCSVNILLCEVFCEVFDVFSHILEQVCLENLKDPGQDIKWGPPHGVMTALIKYLTVLLEYIDLLGLPAKWDPGQNAPVAPPVSSPAYT